jgi:hypothetical protein
MRKMLAVLSLALVAAVSSVAAAQVKPTKAKAKGGDTVSAKGNCALFWAKHPGEPCAVDMGSGEDVTGNGVSPDGTTIFVRPEPDKFSLIRLRKEFVAEIVHSAENH